MCYEKAQLVIERKEERKEGVWRVEGRKEKKKKESKGERENGKERENRFALFAFC